MCLVDSKLLSIDIDFLKVRFACDFVVSLFGAHKKTTLGKSSIDSALKFDDTLSDDHRMKSKT